MHERALLCRHQSVTSPTIYGAIWKQIQIQLKRELTSIDSICLSRRAEDVADWLFLLRRHCSTSASGRGDVIGDVTRTLG